MKSITSHQFCHWKRNIDINISAKGNEGLGAPNRSICNKAHKMSGGENKLNKAA